MIRICTIFLYDVVTSKFKGRIWVFFCDMVCSIAKYLFILQDLHVGVLSWEMKASW
jgi:hypothetical protein